MKKKLYLISLVLVLIAGLSAASACKTAPAQTKPIKIGALLELTSWGADFGTAAKQTITMRLEEANYQVAGRPIEVVWADSATDPATAAEKVKKLVELDKIDLLIAPIFSDSQEAIAPYLAGKGIMAIVMYGIGNWDPLIKPGNWVVFPGTPEASGSPLGDYAYEQGHRTMTTLGFSYSAGYQHVAGFADRFKELGGTIVQQQWAPYGTPDYAPYITALKKADVFGAVLWGADLLIFLRQYYELGVKTPLLMDEIGSLFPQQTAELGKAVLGVKGIARIYYPRLDTPANTKFVTAFKAKFNRPPNETDVTGYVSTSILLEGLEATKGNPKLEVLRPAIKNLKMDTPAGPVSFSPNVIADTNRYLVEGKLVNGEYGWELLKTYEKVRDPRDK